jgi:Fe-S-cluster containining protein
MYNPPPEKLKVQNLKELVQAAAGRAEVRDAIAALYADVQREIDRRKPVCKTSGRCCNFDQFGHRLYVTTMELATFVWNQPAPAPSDPSTCPFQLAGLCSVHAIRPFGCRVFFCDATAQQWQNEQYEQFHARLRQLHDQLDVPYRYVEWRAALAELGLGGCAEPINRLSLGQLRL